MDSLMLLFLMAMLASPLSSSLGMSKINIVAYVVGPFVVELLNCVTVSSKSFKVYAPMITQFNMVSKQIDKDLRFKSHCRPLLKKRIPRA